MFTKYAAIVKNLRGVLLFNLEEKGVEDRLDWLIKRFKYRNLGITPTLLSKYHETLKDRLEGKPFRKLVYPISGLDGVIEIISKALNIPPLVSEVLAFSSIYISPLLVIGDTFRENIENNSIEIIKICKKMDVKSWKLHLRIADYTILDMYEENVNEALEIINKLKMKKVEINEVERIVKSRIARVKKDAKRYWRIKCDKGKPFLYYIDPLVKLILKEIRGELDINRLSEEYAVSLTIIPAIYIPVF